MPERIDCGLDIKHDFPCWDWNRSATPEPPTPRRELVCQVLTFRAWVLRDLRAKIRQYGIKTKAKHYPLIEDCVFAMLWVAIMRARFENGGLEFIGDAARVNVMVPGNLNAEKPRYQPDYFGNSTVAAVASCDSVDLIGDPVDNFGFWHTKRVARAAELLRRAQREINEEHIRKLCSLKQAISPADDRLAYDRALKRHTDSLSFEDWTCYGAQYKGHLPFVDGPQTCFFPCKDHLQEGTVILLPREDERDGLQDWHVCVCLSEDDLQVLLWLLEEESLWIPADDRQVRGRPESCSTTPIKERVLAPKKA
ncbi:hypothetical protein ACJ41O_013317 [Fusarium nematophilum]